MTYTKQDKSLNPSIFKLVDSHCHLNFPDFKEDLDTVIQSAWDKGVQTLLTINTKLSEALEIQTIADCYPHVFCTVGVHPHEAEQYTYKTVREDIKKLCNHPKVVGLGETGLDYYYHKSPQESQLESFRSHIDLSKELDLPLIIHTRDADEDTISLLGEYSNLKGVFHCFSGSTALAKEALKRGFYLSFSGILTFKNAHELREIATWAPIDQILVETDAPFLAPVPYRGKRNEPAYTYHTAELLAQLKGLTLEEIAHATTTNFFTLFSKAVLPT